MDINKNANLSMLCDFYELTMGNGYFVQGMQDRITYFDIFFRSVPDNGGYAIAAGLEQAIEYIQQLHCDEDDISYLRSRNMFDEGFLSYLRDFRFTGDIWAVPEGTPIFPREPIMTVRAPAIQAQLVETFLLLTLNHRASSPPRPTASSARPRGAWCWSSAPAAPRASTPRSTVRARPISATARARPAR